MPLITEIVGGNKTKQIKLLLIVTILSLLFRLKETTFQSMRASVNLRNQLKAYCEAYLRLKDFETYDLKGKIYNPDDPRHDVVEHLCSYDKNANHFHLKFKSKVGICEIQKLICRLALAAVVDSSIDKIWGAASRVEVLRQAQGYFRELKKDPAAQACEKDYFQEKYAQYLTEKRYYDKKAGKGVAGAE